MAPLGLPLFRAASRTHTCTHTHSRLTDTHLPHSDDGYMLQRHICATEECLCLTHVAHPRVWQRVRHLSASVIEWYMGLQDWGPDSSVFGSLNKAGWRDRDKETPEGMRICVNDLKKEEGKSWTNEGVGKWDHEESNLYNVILVTLPVCPYKVKSFFANVGFFCVWAVQINTKTILSPLSSLCLCVFHVTTLQTCL